MIIRDATSIRAVDYKFVDCVIDGIIPMPDKVEYTTFDGVVLTCVPGYHYFGKESPPDPEFSRQIRGTLNALKRINEQKDMPK